MQLNKSDRVRSTAMPRKSAKPPPSPAYAVGRGKPPKEHQFKKGAPSRNKKGRPRGSKNLSTLLREAAEGKVTATVNGKKVIMSRAQATAWQLATKASAGDPKAMPQFLNWIDEIERRAAAARPAEFPFSDADLEVLKQVHERMVLCQAPKNDA